MANTVTVTVPNTVIQANAFANLFSSQFSAFPPNTQINLVIEIGPGTALNSNAFSTSGVLPNGVQIATAAINFINFSENSAPITLGANSFSGLPVQSLVLPAQTVIQANALLNLPELQVLDISQVTTPIVTNALNLDRSTTVPLSLVMPSSPNVTFQSGSIVLPPSSTGNTTTIVFNGAIPNPNELNEMFVTNPNTNAPVQVAINFSTTSNVTQEQINAINSNLTSGTNVPLAVSYTQILNVISGITSPSVVTGNVITSINQFAGDYFEYCIIASTNSANSINQCVVTGLTSDALKNGVMSVPLPDTIKKANVDYSVIGIVTKMELLGNNLIPDLYYILENYADPSDSTLPTTPLVAVFNKNNALETTGGFKPGVLSNGEISYSEGDITITGTVGASTSFCKGYLTPGVNVLSNLLENNTVGSSKFLYDANSLVNSAPIAEISYPSTTSFVIKFQPVTVNGSFESYNPTGDVKILFTNMANKANAVSTLFLSSIASLISNNNELVNLITEIRNYSLPAGITSSLPTVVSISNELSALSKSNFNNSFTLWTDLRNMHNQNYLTYLNNISSHVISVINQANTQTSSDYVSTKLAFQSYDAALTAKKELVNTKLMNVSGNPGSFFRDVVSHYFKTRFSMGIKTFKNSIKIKEIVNFGLLVNLNQVNDELFSGCSSLNHQLVIPSNVTQIGIESFKNCSNVTGIDIQEAFGLRVIKKSAFEGCSKATGSLSFSSAVGATDSVEHIYERAFFGCSLLTNHLYFPKGLKSLGESAFENCSNLNGTIVFPVNSDFTTIAKRCFAGCLNLTGISNNTGNGTSLQYPPPTTPTPLPTPGGNIPNGLLIPLNVIKIEDEAFMNCSKFEGKLNLHNFIQSIGDAAFANCSSFTELIFPNISSVNKETFKNCVGFKQLTIPLSVIYINDGAFMGCNKIENVPALTNVEYIGIEAFKGCSEMKGPLTFGSNLTILGSRSFFDCQYLTSVTFLNAPPFALNESSLIFGMTSPSNTTLYVNVFTQNGWNGAAVSDVTATLNIHNVFRNFVSAGAKSVVQLSYIDFNIYVKNEISRDITIENYESFKAYTNTNGQNTALAIPTNGFTWNDVYIPETLRGINITNAQANKTSLSAVENQFQKSITPAVDSILTDTVNLELKMNDILRYFDGRNLVVKMGTNNTPISLVKATQANQTSTQPNWYGVHNNLLYYAANNNEESQLVKNITLFVTTVESDLLSFNNQLISVDANGAISNTHITPIGYGVANSPTSALYSNTGVTTAQVGRGYTIVTGTSGSFDKLYFETVYAQAGAYFVAKVSLSGVASGSKYEGRVIYVNQTGDIHIPGQDVIKITVENTAADVTSSGYYFVNETLSGSNVTKSLRFKPQSGSDFVPTSGYYQLVSSDTALNNSIIYLLPNGGIVKGQSNSSNSSILYGISGSNHTTNTYVSELVQESIPFYNSNPKFVNLKYLSDTIFKQNDLNYTNDLVVLNKLMSSTQSNTQKLALQVNSLSTLNRVINSQEHGTAFLNSVDALHSQFNLSQIQSLLFKYNSYVSSSDSYSGVLNVFKKLLSGQIATGKPGLYGIQSETLNNETNGLYNFQRVNTYNTNALTVNVENLVSDIQFITLQIKQFAKEILFVQYNTPVSVANYLTTTVPSVKNNSKFLTSPGNSPILNNYVNLSIQQKVLFDYTASLFYFWLLSSGDGAAGSSGWGNKLSTPPTGLYSVAQVTGNDETNKNSLLAWAETNVFPYFGSTSVYEQFLQNNSVPSLEIVRASTGSYETSRASNPNDLNLARNAGKNAYINAVRVVSNKIVPSQNVKVNTATFSAISNGTLFFNNTNQTLSTVLIVSLVDGNAANINLVGYADTIVLNNSLTYSLISINKTANYYELSVVYVSGASIADQAVLTMGFYHTESPHILSKLDSLNDFVFDKYNQTYSDELDNNASVVGIKSYLTKVTNLLTVTTKTLGEKLSDLNNSVSSNLGILSLASSVNSAEDVLTTRIRVGNTLPDSGNTLSELNSANMLVRELELLQNALDNKRNGNLNATPNVNNLPSYELKWFHDRIAKYWNDSLVSQPTIASRTTAYNTANQLFETQRELRQQAIIDYYIALVPPSLGEKLPLLTASISGYASKIMILFPAFVKTNTNKNVLANLIATRITDYIYRRDLETNKALYESNEKVKATDALNIANNNYGKASYSRYCSLIDLAIVTAYSAGHSGGVALKENQVNQFQILLQKWKQSSNKNAAFDDLKGLLFNFVYKTDNTVYNVDSFPLKANGVVISWFGENDTSGFLYQVISNGLSFLTAVANSNDTTNGIPFTAYDLSPLSITVNGVNTQVQRTIPSEPSSVTPAILTPSEYATSLSTPASTTNLASKIANPASLQSAQSEVYKRTLVYYVTNIGYHYVSDIPTERLSQALASLQFSTIQPTPNDLVRYRFQLNSVYYHGHEQPNTLINSWSKLNASERVVVFYAGTTDASAIPVNLANIQSNMTTLCDDAAFVMTINPISGSAEFNVALYSYDVMGINSGVLYANGLMKTFTNSPPVVTMYKPSGAFQKVENNPSGHLNGIAISGSVTIGSGIKVIGVNAFANSQKLVKLTLGSDTLVDSLRIGSNAFDGCSGLKEINLGNNVASLGPSTFLNCVNLKTLSLPNLPSTFSFINHWSFLGCNTLDKLVLNRNIIQIGVQSFARCIKMTCTQLNGGNEYIPVETQRIGIGAFFGCSGLTGALNFNNKNVNGAFISSISFIGAAAFMGCSGLNGGLSLPINPGYKNVLPYTFSSGDAVIRRISGAVLTTNYPNNTMSFTGPIELTSLHHITTIEEFAFHKCSFVSSLLISNILTKIGNNSLKQCSNISGVLQFPATLLDIGVESFRGCSKITGLNFLSSTVSQSSNTVGVSLGAGCFRECSELIGSTMIAGNTLIIPNNVISVGDSAFEGCVKIQSVNIGSGLTSANSFGEMVFKDCVGLTRVTLAFSFFAKNVSGQYVVKKAVLATPTTNPSDYNNSFSGCTGLGVGVTNPPTGTIQIQSGATNWTPDRAIFFNNLTIVVNNRNIIFYFKEFNQNITVVDPSKETLQTDPLPVTDAQANVYVKASDMRKVFRISTDSHININSSTENAVEHERIFFVLPEFFPQYLNVANASVVQGSIENSNSAKYEQLLKDDVLRYYALTLFNSADWVTLFANDTEMMENMVASAGLMPLVPNGDVDSLQKNLSNVGTLYSILETMNAVSYTNPKSNPNLVQSTNYPENANKWWGLPETVPPEQGNLCMKLFNIINRNDPNRVSSMAYNSSVPNELPFLPGDEIVFTFTLNENKISLSSDQPPVVVKPRSYLIRLSMVEDFNSGSSNFMDHARALYNQPSQNANVIPVSGAYGADYMYSNYDLYVAIKPSNNVALSSVYSKVTENSFEPIPQPLNTLPFTGWYYSYPTHSQSVRLNFTPYNISSTNPNKIVYRDMRYLNAHVYFPNNWQSTTSLPKSNNFPKWVVKFTDGSRSVTFNYPATFLNQNAEVINFLGQTVKFDYNNTHIQLLCSFDLTTNITNFANSELSTLLSGQTADGQPGQINAIAGTDIWRQRNNQLLLVNGLRKNTNQVGPFTYPPVSRGYQCISMPTTKSNGLSANHVQIVPPFSSGTPSEQLDTILTALTDINSTFYLESVFLEINMSNTDGFVPSIIVKSVEVVSKKYESYYLAPLNPN